MSSKRNSPTPRRTLSRLLPSLAVSLLLGLSLTSCPRNAESNTGSATGVDVLFRQGIEALDFERWREATILLERAAAADPHEGGARDVQIYGHRWSPYLPHFFLGVALFEVGYYREALGEWEESERQLGLLEPERLRRTQRRYIERRLAERDPFGRFWKSTAPAHHRQAEGAIDAASEALERLRTTSAVVGEGFVSIDLLDRLSDSVEQARATIHSAKRLLDPVARRHAKEERLAQLRAGVESLSSLARASDVAEMVLGEVQVEQNRVDREILRLLSPHASHSVWFDLNQGSAVLARSDLFWTSFRPLASNQLADSSGGRTDWVEALSKYLGGVALAATRPCEDISAVALDRLTAAAEFDLGRGDRTIDPRLADSFRPHLMLARAAARCGDTVASEAHLSRARMDNEAARRAALELRASLRLTDRAATYPGDSVALVIGVWEYDDWPDLPGAESDFHAVRGVLEAQGFDVRALANPDHESIERELSSVGRTIERGGRVLLYYAGHGHRTRSLDYPVEVGWIVPRDAPPADSTDFVQRAISMDRVRNWSLLELDDVRQQLFVFDSCFSGAVFLDRDTAEQCPGGADGSRTPSFLRTRSSVPRLEGAPFRMYLSAGNAEQRVPDRSRFGEAFVGAIDGAAEEADADGDGYLLADTELGPFLKRRVRSPRQTPQWRTLCDRGDFVFRLATPPPEFDWAFDNHCDANPALVLADVLEWESRSARGEYRQYLERTRCGVFSDLARALERTAVDRVVRPLG